MHHVMIRGVDGQAIFASDSDREDFASRFDSLVRELEFSVFGWCLLGNHAHLVLKTGQVPLAVLMARLGSRHAQRFNRSAARNGHLFQDRYKAVPIQSDERLARDTAYALGNPVRHGLMPLRELQHYAYSGYGALVGSRPARGFESPSATAGALGVGRTRVESFVGENALAPDARSAELEPDQIEELNLLIRDCCRQHGIEASALESPPLLSQAMRAEILLRAVDSLSLTAAEIALRLGLPYRTAKRILARVPGS